jgi:hypothetical protein
MVFAIVQQFTKGFFFVFFLCKMLFLICLLA